MTDKEKAAQEVQEVTEYEQTALFGDQSEDEASKATIAEIKEILEEVEAIRNSEEYGTNELLFKLEEITVLAERCAAPRSLRIVCKSAADTANAVYTITGDSRFDAIAARLRYIEDEADIADQAALYTGMIERSESSVVFTSNGNGYLLPEELEAYREENPVGAEMYEQESKKEAPAGVHKLNIVLHYDPKLDPSSPEFDYDLWREAMFSVDENGENASYRAIKKVTSKLKDLGRAAIEAQKETEKASFSILEEASRGILQKMAAIAKDNMGASMQLAQEMLDNFINSDTYKAIKESTAVIKEFLEEHKEELEAARKVAEETEKLHPYLLQEIEEANKANPDMVAITLYDVLDCMEVNGEPITEIDGQPFDNPFIGIIERSKQRKADIEAAQEVQEVIGSIEKYSAVKPQQYDLAVDKLNHTVWTLLESADKTGQLQLATERRGSNKEATVFYSLDFDGLGEELRVTEQLKSYDHRVMQSYSALMSAGNSVFSLQQIYATMGNTSRPSTKDLEKISRSLNKMNAGHVYIDNTEEIKVNKKYDRFVYDGSLLPFERVSAYINNKLCEAAIHPFREPPLISFARDRGQITQVPIAVLQSPVSKTEETIMIDDYLQWRIARHKDGNSPAKILYETVFKRCNITSSNTGGKKETDAIRLKKFRAKEKIKKLLDHYKSCGWIKGYTEATDGITIKV